MTEELSVDSALIGRAALGLIAVLALAAFTGIFLRDPVSAAGEAFIGQFGWAGVFIGVLLCDASPLPLTHEPIVLLAVAQGLNPWTVGGVAAAASVTAGPVGFAGGWLLRTRSGARGWLERRSPAMVHFLQRWGATGVAIAAVLPIPFALATWTAGLVEVDFPRVCAASLLRIPKTLFYLSLIVQGWALGA